MNTTKDITVRDVSVVLWKMFRQKAIASGLTVREALSQAIRKWLNDEKR